MVVVGEGFTANVLRLPPIIPGDREDNVQIPLDDSSTISLHPTRVLDVGIHTGVDKRMHHRIYIREGEWKGAFAEYIASHEQRQRTSRVESDEDPIYSVATLRIVHNGLVVNVPFEYCWDWCAH